ncbi:hypothetical protein I302_100612 [Kwoniella bestiolae CBS 10118]|uniref:Uncharacterized protein n=1 Tax=Kwoniella bestiolae CBS 10118 TaxID=1296100 RepID=A0A1B9G5L7_9TREE|nr:hypothetical protein I302_03986 [Kwoniella bestiolae CBS 10118]OCF26303.1 hypothetical protein I302_03986 [Kwoniella bestiolae CBS 10118]
MDLSTLGSTLPPGLADAERDMGDKFRAAALSITNLYKSSLGYTKQAYNVGYSAALADVLSTVQSSIGAGQDAEQTLSRLMDWADARQAAISAFAAEDTDDLTAPAPTQAIKRPSAIPRNSNLNPPNRPASAPVPTQPSSFKDNQPIASSSRSVQPIPPTSNTTTPSTNTSITESPAAAYQPTPGGIMSSSPMASPSNNHQRNTFSSLPKPSKNLPSRYSQLNLNQTQGGSGSGGSSSAALPSTSFNPSLPSAGVPFVSFTNSTENNAEGPAQNYPTGTKRPMIDSMEIDQVIPPTTAVNPAMPVQTPPNRSGRSNKRRSLGNSLNSGNNDQEGEKERKRGSRRGHGHGHGGNGASAV